MRISFRLFGRFVICATRKSIVGATVAVIIEALPLPISDNILIPLCAGAALTLIT